MDTSSAKPTATELTDGTITRELFDAWNLERATLRSLYVQATNIFAVIAAKDVRAASAMIDVFRRTNPATGEISPHSVAQTTR
jgi:hypothetical protein